MEGGRKTEVLLQVFLLDDGRERLVQGNLLRRHARNLRNLLLQTTHAGLMCVLVNDFGQCTFINAEFLLADSVLFKFARQEEFLGDFHLLFRKIAGDIDKFHSVQKCRLNGGNVIGSRDEQDMG